MDNENLENQTFNKDSVVDRFLAEKLGNTAMTGSLKKDIDSVSPERLLTTEEIADFAKKFHEEEIKEAPGQIQKVASEIRELELDFSNQVERSLEKDELHIPEREFLFWEDDYTDLWNEIENQKMKGGLDSYQEAKAEEDMFFTTDEGKLSKTIEAQAGIFFAKREEELIDAINENDGSLDEIKYVNGFAASVARHLDYKYMTAEEIRTYGYNEYEKDRTRIHNDAIRHLNGLNHLAEKYGTRRFTPRNFWTSDVPVSQQTDAMAKRMRYDRDVVEEYYNHAFRREATRRKAIQDRALRYGVNY